tara:strand:- start:26 stop:247 length:222 start_codon:yes stop_codon:yes gene_type:complete
MEYQLLFNATLGLVAFFGGWTLNSITKTIERLDIDVRNLPHNYVAKDDYRSDIKDVKLMLSKIFERLDNKADK